MPKQVPADPADALILDLLEWVAAADRSHAEVMEAWRTSCPRLPVWENAVDRGLLARQYAAGKSMVVLTPLGRALLAQEGRAQASSARVTDRMLRSGSR